MGTVTITFTNDITKHYIDAVCSISRSDVIVYQYNEDKKVKRIHFDKQIVKSVHYDA